MRFTLLAAPITFVLLMLSGHAMAAQDEFVSEEVPKLFEDYRSELRKIEEDIPLARAQWEKVMGEAQEKAMKALDLKEANAIQADRDSVQSGWPSFDSGEHEVLVEGWTSTSPFAAEAKKAYQRAVDRAANKSMEAREALGEALSDVLKEVLSGGSEADLMEANRIQAWLGGDVTLEVEPPKGWEIIFSEAEAKERKLWRDYTDEKPADGEWLRFARRSDTEKSGVHEFWINHSEGIEQSQGDGVLTGTSTSKFYWVGDRWIYRNESGEFIAAVISGSGEAKVVFSDDPGGGVMVAFEGSAPKKSLPTVSLPWPLSVPAVKKVQEDLLAACEEMGAFRSSLKGTLIEHLEEVFKVTMRSGDLPESILINELIEELKENEEMILDDLDQWGLTSADALAHIETYSRGLDESFKLPSVTKLALVTKLERARSDAMKQGGPSALQTANRIQETIRELLESEALCSSSVVVRAVETPPGASKEYKARDRAYIARGRALKRHSSIRNALDWLVAHQDPDGKWDSDEFNKHDKRSARGNIGAGQKEHDIGVTGLALMAFLDCGVELDSAYGQALVKGAQWLLMQQDYETGHFGRKVGYAYMYNHGIATIALCRLYAISGNPVFAGPAQKAINFISRARNPYGAWRYESPPDGEMDTSVTGWMILAVKTAEDAGLKIDAGAYAGATSWIDEATDTGTGRVGYDDEGTPSARVPGVNDDFETDITECMTAVGLMARFHLGQTPKDTPIMGEHADLILKRLPGLKKFEWHDEKGVLHVRDGEPVDDIYYWYWATSAMSEMDKDRWKVWEKAMKKIALSSQRSSAGGSNYKGSWNPDGPWGYAGGRVYATAMMTSVLAKVLE